MLIHMLKIVKYFFDPSDLLFGFRRIDAAGAGKNRRRAVGPDGGIVGGIKPIRADRVPRRAVGAVPG